MEHSRGHLSEAQLDSAFHVGGLVVRVVGYAALAAVASHYDFGRALLAGLFYGDLAATAAAMFVRGAAGLIDTAGELLLLLLVALCVGGMLRVPEDAAQRAVLTLAALGVFTSRIGHELMTRLRPG